MLDGHVVCVDCGGAGVQLGLFPKYAPGYEGERKADRLERKIGLRSEAKRRGIKPSELSAMEQGTAKPV